MSTAAQIRNKAAGELGLLATGQTLQSDISSDLDDAYAELYAELSAKELVTWDEDEDVPSEYVNDVVMLVAQSRANRYPIPTERYNRIILAASGATQNIRTLQASNVYKTPTATYY